MRGKKSNDKENRVQKFLRVKWKQWKLCKRITTRRHSKTVKSNKKSTKNNKKLCQTKNGNDKNSGR